MRRFDDVWEAGTGRRWTLYLASGAVVSPLRLHSRVQYAGGRELVFVCLGCGGHDPSGFVRVQDTGAVELWGGDLQAWDALEEAPGPPVWPAVGGVEV